MAALRRRSARATRAGGEWWGIPCAWPEGNAPRPPPRQRRAAPGPLAHSQLRANRVVDTLVMNVDLAPTFAELAGVTPPPGTKMNGKSLAGLVTGASGEVSRAQVLTECWAGSGPGPDTHAAVRTDRYEYVEHYEDTSRAKVRTHSAGGRGRRALRSPKRPERDRQPAPRAGRDARPPRDHARRCREPARRAPRRARESARRVGSPFRPRGSPRVSY